MSILKRAYILVVVWWGGDSKHSKWVSENITENETFYADNYERVMWQRVTAWLIWLGKIVTTYMNDKKATM